MNNSVTSEQDIILTQDLVQALMGLEAIRHTVFTPRMGPNLESLGKIAGRLQQAADGQKQVPDNEGSEARHAALLECAGQIVQIVALLNQAMQGGIQNSMMKIMRALRIACRIQETLFFYHTELEPLNRYWLEPGRDLPVQTTSGSSAGTGLFHIGSTAGQYERGCFSVYIPDTIARNQPIPLIVALHGGYGHGRDFIWTWIRAARRRGYILLAPTSKGDTWSIMNPGEDGKIIQDGIAFTEQKQLIDAGRMLITGVSDGATYALASCLQPDYPFAAGLSFCSLCPGCRYAAAR